MLIKTIPPRFVLSFTTETTLRESPSFAGIIAAKLYAVAAAGHALPVGPINWIYAGADGKPDTIFMLEIVLPVNRVPEDCGEFQHKELPSFACMEMTHEGKWEELPGAYAQIMSELIAAGKVPTGICREEYIHMDFTTGANNITLVQIGIS